MDPVENTLSMGSGGSPDAGVVAPSFMRRMFDRMAASPHAGFLLLISALLLPSACWVLCDYRVWPWDQAWYGETTSDLWYTLRHHIAEWPSAMKLAIGQKPPGIAWFGQFFVPLRLFLGSAERAMMCSVLLTQFATLWMLHRIAATLLPGRSLAQMAVVITAASAPLFIGLSHQYLTEPLQTFSVTWVFLAALKSSSWPRKDVLFHLSAAGCVGILAKAPTPMFCVFPAAIALAFLFTKREAGASRVSRLHYCAWALLFILIGETLVWYHHNYKFVLWHVREASSGEVALAYGTQNPFVTKIATWMTLLQRSFFMNRTLFALFGAFLGAAVVTSLRGGLARNFRVLARPSILLPLAAFFQIALLIVVYSLNITEDTRYTAPILPCFAILTAAILARMPSKPVTGLFLVVLSFQWMLVHLQALGFTHRLDHITEWVMAPWREREPMREVGEIVGRTTPRDAQGRYNIVGVEEPWLNANSLAFFAAKQRLDSGVRCYYTSLGYAEQDMQRAWQRLEDFKILHFITLETSSQRMDLFNKASRAVLERVEGDSSYKRMDFESKRGVLIFERASTQK